MDTSTTDTTTCPSARSFAASISRRFRLEKLAKGDYVFLSNDAQTLWRVEIMPYVGDGEDCRCRTHWMIHRWIGSFAEFDAYGHATCTLEPEEPWECGRGPFCSRAEAIAAALHWSEREAAPTQ